MATHSICILSYYLLAPFTDRDQYPICFSLLSSYSCRNMHLTWKPQTYVSSATYLQEQGSAKTEDGIRKSLSAFSAAFFTFIGDLDILGCSFRRRLIRGAAHRAKLRTKRRNIIYRPRDTLSCVSEVDGSSTKIALVVYNAISIHCSCLLYQM